MDIVKYILIALDVIVCAAIILITTIQGKEDQGASGAIVGSSTDNFYEKNKGRTREGKLKRLTILLAIAFAVCSIALSIVYAI